MFDDNYLPTNNLNSQILDSIQSTVVYVSSGDCDTTQPRGPATNSLNPGLSSAPHPQLEDTKKNSWSAWLMPDEALMRVGLEPTPLS